MAKHLVLKQAKIPDHKSPVERPDFPEITSLNPKKILGQDSMDLHYFPRTWRICLETSENFRKIEIAS